MVVSDLAGSVGGSVEEIFGHRVLVLKRCPFRSKQNQKFRSVVQFPFTCPGVALTIRNKIAFPFVATLDCAFGSGLGDRNKHLSRAGQAIGIFHGNNRIPPYLPARSSSQDLIPFDPHGRRNCCRTRGENNTHQNDRSVHLPKRTPNNGECINRDNCVKQFLIKKSAPRVIVITATVATFTLYL